MPSTPRESPLKRHRYKDKLKDKGRSKGKPALSVPPSYATAKTKSKVCFPDAVSHLIHFLRQVDRHPALYLNRPILREAIRRYEFFWLPLLASVDHDLALHLAPPLDVEWVHYCHMLSPHQYRADMVALLPSSARLENVFDRRLLSPVQREAARKKTRAVWALHCLSEPYDVEVSLAEAPLLVYETVEEKDALPPNSRLSFDFFAAASRQVAFHHQIAVLPQYEDQTFLETATYHYLECFLRLKKEFPDKRLVPSRAIATVWCVHALHPSLYFAETSAMLGEMLQFDGSLDSGLAGTELILAVKETQVVWAQTFRQRGPSTYGELWRGQLSVREFKLRPLLTRLIACYEKTWSYQNVNALEAVESSPGKDFPLLSSEKPVISWVHSQSLRNCQTASGGVLHRVSGVSEKYADLVMRARNERLVSVLCGHIVYGLGMTEKPGLVLLAQLGYVQVFGGGAAQLSTDDIPLASAERLHYALPRTPKGAKREEAWHHAEGDESVLLRIGGEDFAILKFKPTGEVSSVKDRLVRMRPAMEVRRQYDLFFCPLQGKQRGKGILVRLSKMRGKASEVSKVSANFLNDEELARNEMFVLSKRSSKFLEWDIQCSSSRTVLLSFLIGMAESMIELGNDQYTRECCRRKSELYEM